METKTTLMKTIQKMHFVASTLLLFVMMVLSKAAWAQPVVTVPASCNVVVAGAGGTTGFGGTVGSGGIVVMPDPFSGGNFTVNPLGNTILGWSLAGDLSVGPITQPAPAVQSVASGVLIANIQSYNKLVRASEQTFPSAALLARSKGRISIAYTNATATCGGGISFDVFKQYVNNGWPSSGTQAGYVPPIIGPDCLEPSQSYTYSVDQIASDNYSAGIGGDEYYWSITPSIGTFYTSADNSSITFTTPSTLSGAYTLKTCFGRANPWDANVSTPSTCVTKVVGLQPGTPNFTTFPPTCVQTTATASFNIVINPVVGYTYSWTSSNPTWFLTQSGTQNQNLTASSLGSDPATLTLTVTNGSCDPSIFTYIVNRELASPVTIVSTGTGCVAAGSTTNYSLSAGLQNTTCWTVPSGWVVANANAAGSSINLTVPAGTAAGSYVISAKSCACPAGVLNFTVNVRPAVPTITGPACVIRNGGPTVNYTATGATGASSYTWTYPSGFLCVANCTTNNPTVLPGGSTNPPQTITVTANGVSGCNAVSTASFAVNYSPITPSTIAVNCWSVGVPGSTTVTVANAPSPFYGNYTVTSSPSGLIGSYSVNASTGVITINTTGTAPTGSYTLFITHTTGSPCGSSTTVSYPITYAGNGTTVTPVYNPGVGNSDVYITSGAPVGSTYQWYVNGTAVPAGSGGTASVLVLSGNGTPPTTVCVNVTSGGCTTRICATPGTHNLAPLDPTGSIERMLAEVKVFPNPNDGNFTMKIPAFEKEAMLQIIDANGREIGIHRLKEGENQISERYMKPGEYFLILNIDGNSDMGYTPPAESGAACELGDVSHMGCSHHTFVVSRDVHKQFVECHILLREGSEQIVKLKPGDRQDRNAIQLGVIQPIQQVNAAGP